jgi:DNA-binding MarR family transcriptional regulator
MPKHYYKVDRYQSRRSIGYLLRHAGKLITGRIEALFLKEEVSFVQWVILMHLREGLSSTAAELCQHLCHDSGALTRVIDQMEERGLLRRQRSTDDRRVVTLEMTEEGGKTTGLFLPHVVGLYNGLLSDFTKAEADQFVSSLIRVIAKLQEPAEH